MNVKTTVVLIVLLAVGLGYVAWQYTDWFTGKPTTPPAPDKRLTPDAGKVTRLVIETPRVGRVVLVADGDDWRLAEPVDAPAVRYEAGGTVTDVTTLKYVRKYAPDDPDRPKQTRLADPVRIVTFTDDKNNTCTLRVGGKTPILDRTYVQIEGDDHIYVVDVDLAERLAKTASDYRDKKLLDFDTARAVRVTVTGEKDYQLIKTDGAWAIDKPVSARADAAKVSSLLSDLAGLRAEKFDNDNPKELAGYGLTKPIATVTVELAPPEPKTKPADPSTQPARGKVLSIAFGATADAKAETLFAKLGDKPWVFQIKKSRLSDIPRLLDVRDKTVLDLAGEEITGIESTLDAEGTLKLVKEDGSWKMLKPFAGPADPSAGDLARAIKDLKATEFQDAPTSLAAYRLDPPRGKIVLDLRGKGRTVSLLLGGTSSSGEMAFVRPEGAKFVAVVSADDYAKLLKGARQYWSRQFIDLPAGAEVTEVTLDRPDESFILRRGEDGKLTLTAPVAAPVDTDHADAVVNALTSLTADSIASLGEELPKRFAQAKSIRVMLNYRVPLPPEPPATAPATATAPTTGPATATAPTTTTAPAEPKVRQETGKVGPLLVAKDGGHSYVWKLSARPVAVGELGADLHDKLNAELRERQVLTVKVDDVSGVTLDLNAAKPDKTTIALKKIAGRWTLADDPLVPIDPSKVADFLKDLDIKADRFADYTDKPDLKRFGLDQPETILQLKLAGDKKADLKLSRTGPVGTEGRYATGGDVPGVFVLSEETVKKIRKTLKDFKKP